MQFKKFQEQKSNSRDNKSKGRFSDVLDEEDIIGW